MVELKNQTVSYIQLLRVWSYNWPWPCTLLQMLIINRYLTTFSRFKICRYQIASLETQLLGIRLAYQGSVYYTGIRLSHLYTEAASRLHRFPSHLQASLQFRTDHRVWRVNEHSHVTCTRLSPVNTMLSVTGVLCVCTLLTLPPDFSLWLCPSVRVLDVLNPHPHQ